MDYLEFRFVVPQGTDFEIIAARLADSGFESFMESDQGITGYIREDHFDEEAISGILENMKPATGLTYSFLRIESRNWNAEWESSYEPVIVKGQCMIRAPFHQPVAGILYNIVIEPKMSFGTGHHETTAMMIGLLLEEPVQGKTVLDMGCGTGVLAILAMKMGAASATAIDNDEWAFSNATDNIRKNLSAAEAAGIRVIAGDASSIPPERFDLVLANINRNILLQDIRAYSSVLAPHGVLLVSGFLTDDLPYLDGAAGMNGLKPAGTVTENNWVAAKYSR